MKRRLGEMRVGIYFVFFIKKAAVAIFSQMKSGVQG
jgi:hypothetical protein